MRLYVMLAFVVATLPRIGHAQSAFGAQDGTRVSGSVLECATSGPTLAVPCGIIGAPLKVDQGTATVVPPGGGTGVTGFLAGIYQTIAGGLSINGAVAVSNLPAVQVVSGTVSTSDNGSAVRGVSIPNGGSGTTGWLSAIWSLLASTMNVSVTNLPSTQMVSGGVSVINLPAVQQVGGSVAISNLPATQQVSGSVTAMDGGAAVPGASLPSGGVGLTGWLSAILAKLGGTINVSIGNWPTMQPVSGSVSINNFPGTQVVSGTVTSAPPSAAVSDCSTNLVLPGTAYQLVGSSTAKKSMLLQNLGASNAGFSLTNSAPSIGALGTFTLVPNASFQLAPGAATSNAVYAVGTAASQLLACTLFQ